MTEIEQVVGVRDKMAAEINFDGDFQMKMRQVRRHRNELF